MGTGEYHKYRKKINLDSVSNCFYDHEMSTFMVINRNSLTQVRNDKNNNFNALNSVVFEGFGNITMSSFCQKTKLITFLTQ